MLFHTAYNQAETVKDKNGKAVKGRSKSDQVRRWLKEMDGLTGRQKKFLWGTVYQSEW